MASMDELRAGVRKSLPEIEEIKDPELRERVVEAWAYALSRSEFTSIDEIRPSGNPTSPLMTVGTQADHVRAVALMAVATAEAVERVLGPIGVDRDTLLASGLCHDLGKPFEFSPGNQARWKGNLRDHGYPAIHHSAYGVHVALTVGLPEKVAHVCNAHAAEAGNIERSLENTLVHFADHSFWRILGRAGMLEQNEGATGR